MTDGCEITTIDHERIQSQHADLLLLQDTRIDVNTNKNVIVAFIGPCSIWWTWMLQLIAYVQSVRWIAQLSIINKLKNGIEMSLHDIFVCLFVWQCILKKVHPLHFLTSKSSSFQPWATNHLIYFNSPFSKLV